MDSSGNFGHETFSLRLHPLQDQVPPQQLLKVWTHRLMDAVSDVGEAAHAFFVCLSLVVEGLCVHLCCCESVMVSCLVLGGCLLFGGSGVVFGFASSRDRDLCCCVWPLWLLLCSVGRLRTVFV